MATPSITDWIQAIGVLLALPSIVWGIINLFIKDKIREKQISALSKMQVPCSIKQSSFL